MCLVNLQILRLNLIENILEFETDVMPASSSQEEAANSVMMELANLVVH